MADYSVLQPNKPTNLAGYCRVAYCAVDQVAVGGFPRVLASRLTDTITLASGETFSSMPLLATTLQLTEREITDTQGTRFETTLTGRLPMAVAQRDDLFRIMVQRRWLAVGTDGNGNQRLLGTPRYPARFSFEHDNAQGRNEYVVTWRAITPHPALYVESVTVPTPGVCAAATVTVNGDSPALSVASGGAVNLTNVNSAGTPIGSRSGSVITNGDMTLDYPDGTTEALVLVPGGTVVIDPELIIGLAGTESSYTFTTPAWDTSFTVSAQTVSGGGSISNVVVDGGAPVSTFVGASIPASVVVSFDITGAVTSVKLEF